MQYIKMVAKEEIWNSGYVQLWDFSRAQLNEESKTEAVATVASICYGQPAKNAKKLVERLSTESGGLPSSAFEFIRDGDKPRIEDSLRNNPELADAKSSHGLSQEDVLHKHRSNIATFRIKVPIFVARQLMRHRTFSYQELSRRYTDDDRVPLAFWSPTQEEIGPTAVSLFSLAYSLQAKIYRLLRELNVRAEIARSVLGTGLFTELWMMGDAPAWENYFKLRLESHTQKEHRELARVMYALLLEYQPEFSITPVQQGDG
jgi:flavin-dependent thymidylate synthase